MIRRGWILGVLIVLVVVVPSAAAGARGRDSTSAGQSRSILGRTTCTIGGTPDDDVLVGTAGDDVICGEGGDDTLEGRGGDDQLLGGSGSDTVVYADAPGAVTVNLATSSAHGDGVDSFDQIEGIVGSPFGDLLEGSDGPDTLRGGEGDDRLIGRQGDDTLFGERGDDVLYPGGGDDPLTDGAEGTDTVVYASSPRAVTVDLIDQTTQGWGTDGLQSIESALGSRYDDRLIGDDAANLLRGLAGADTLVGHAGNDTLLGTSGNDTFDPGGGSDTVEGGADEDTLTFAAAPSAISLDLGAGEASGWGDVTVRGVEDAVGSRHADTLKGSSSPNILRGLGGGDHLSTADGEAGDTSSGGAGVDVCRGDAGDVFVSCRLR